MALRIESLKLELPEELRELLCTSPVLQRAYVVGGGVRDALLEQKGKDFDVEVYGQDYESLVNHLRGFGRVDLVGKSFGVLKVTLGSGQTYDFSLPRRDSKIAPGHKGFVTTPDAELDPEAATSRRDFTINALLYDPRRNEVHDYHGGLEDLKERTLRHTSAAFTEDPLRVLRGMQFAARFQLKAAPSTIALCQSIVSTYPELAKERVREEWFKWASRSVLPSAGLKFLQSTFWIQHFPEVAILQGVPQDPEWHPEGDVFVHTCHCCDAMATLPEWQSADETTRIVLMLAILAHDFGKPVTTRIELKHGRPRIVSPDHEPLGGPIAERFLERIQASNEIRARVVPLVMNHLAHMQTSTDRAIRRLANRLRPENIEDLCMVMTADSLGRPPKSGPLPTSLESLKLRAREMNLVTEAPKPVLLGRHLLDLGLEAGPTVGEITKAAFEAQLEGEFDSVPGALDWLLHQTQMALPTPLLLRLRQRSQERT